MAQPSNKRILLESDKAAPGGIATLDSGGKVPDAQIPSRLSPAAVLPKWQTATDYTAGQQVISPDGDIVSAAVNHTSGATFTPANWKYVRFSDYFVNVKSYGAKGNGSTNDTAAIQAALNAAAANPVAGQIGGVCYVPAGTYMVNAQLVVPRQVRFIGASSVATKIQAIDGQFPANTAVIRLGEPSFTAAIFSTTVENMRIWCGGTNSIGIYSSEANELCGIFDVSIGAFTDAGVVFERIGSQDPPANATIERLYLNPHPDGSVAGVRIEALVGEAMIRHVTIDGLGAGLTQVGLLIKKCGSMTLMGIHPESCVIGVDVNGDADSAGTIIGVSGHPSNGTLIRMRATGGPNWTATGIRNQGEAVTIQDDYNGVTLTDANVGFYSQRVGATPSALRDAEAFQSVNESSTQVATIPRRGSQAVGATAPGDMLLTYFTPLKPLLVSKIAAAAGAASTGQTLVRMGLYTVAANGTLALVAATASDTTVFAAANTIYERSLSTAGGLPATYRLIAGMTYAIGFLIVGGTPGGLVGQSMNSIIASDAPRLTGRMTGQTDLPAAIAASSLTINESRMIWARCT